MRRTAPASIGEIIADFIKDSPTVSRGLQQSRAIDLWPEVAGETAARFTTSIAVNKGKMFVSLSSSVVRHELFMRRTEIAAAINSRLGADVISTLILK